MSSHRPPLDGLRFILFAAVFAFHHAPATLSFLAHGVSGFFVLSGFLITHVLESAPPAPLSAALRRFYLRRALRILPAYVTTLFVAVVVFGIAYPLWHATFLYNFKLFFLAATLPGTELAAYLLTWHQGVHLWSLCVEEQFYLVFPLVLLATPAPQRVRIIATLVLASSAARVLATRLMPGLFWGALSPSAAEYLLLGGLFALLSANGAISPHRWRAHLGLGVGLIALAWLGHDPLRPELTSFQPQLAQQSVLAFGFAWLVVGLWHAPDTSITARILSFPPLAYLGRISYGLYLWHLFTWEASESVVVRAALTLVLAMVSWHLIEQPLLARKDRWLSAEAR